MKRLIPILTSLALTLSSTERALASGPSEHADGTSVQEIENAMRERPELRQKQKDFEQRLKRQKQTGEADALVRPDDLELDPDIMSRIQELAAASDESFMADIIAEAEVEKAQLVEENIWSAAEAKATPETRALYREYLRRVYFFGGGGGSIARHIAFIKASLEKPRGWGSFPTLKLGPLPPGVAGLWIGGDITLIGPSLVVLSHEWHNHFDGAIESALDGQGEFPNHPEPWEGYAYAHMGEEI